MVRAYLRFLTIGLCLIFSSCGIFSQPGQEQSKVYSRLFFADYNTAWQAAIESLKSFERPVQNRQAGKIETSFVDNLQDKMFTDTFGGSETYLKNRYRFSVNLAPSTYQGKPTVKVAITKELIVQRDVLEGWQPIISDSISENTILYRIGRIIANKNKLRQIEDEKVKNALETF